MAKQEKEELIMKEVIKKYDEYFENIKNKKKLSELESNEESKRFYNEIKEYIKKRKEELRKEQD